MRAGSACFTTERSCDLAEPTKALTLERLLNQGINYSEIADQFLWESVAYPLPLLRAFYEPLMQRVEPGDVFTIAFRV